MKWLVRWVLAHRFAFLVAVVGWGLIHFAYRLYGGNVAAALVSFVGTQFMTFFHPTPKSNVQTEPQAD